MIKTLAVAFSGIFVGAFAMEILNRTNPELTKGIEEKAKKVTDSIARGFKEGWGSKGKGIEPEEVQPEQAAT